MRDYIVERALNIGEYIVSSNATVRQTAKKFGVSKSTVHKDVAERLVLIDRHLAGRARLILDKNKAERHIRGGQATKRKYKPVIVEENSERKYTPGMRDGGGEF